MSKPTTSKSAPKSAKPGTAAKGKKGGKKSKKELEKERELEEQRKREEEAHLLEIKARKEREIKDTKEREAVEKLFAEEAENLQKEQIQLQNILETKSNELDIIGLEIRKVEEWRKFLECSPLPDCSSERDMNTYLNIWADESVGSEENPSVDAFLGQLKDAEELCRQIERELAIATDMQLQNEITRLTQHLLQMRNIIDTKWDQSAALILQYADHFNPKRETNENFTYTTKVDRYVFGVWGNLTKNPRHKNIEFPGHTLSTSLPKPLALANVAIVMLLQTGTTAAVKFDEVTKTTRMAVVGGVLHLELVEMPDPPKTVDKWTVRQVLSAEGKLKRIPYPFKKQVVDPAEQELDDPTSMTQWPAQITYALPRGVFLHPESVTVKYWDAGTQVWDDDGITDVEFDYEKNQVRFRTIHFKECAIVQDAFAEFPYANWHLRPTGNDRATLTINGKTQEVEIEIGDLGCRLLKPVITESDPDEVDLKSSWLPPSLLLKKMSRLGLNFIAPKSMQSINVTEMSIKNPELEENCILGISYCASAYQFQRTPYNKMVGGSRCLIQAAEVSPSEQETNEWKLALFDGAYHAGENNYKSGFIMKETEFIDEGKHLPEDSAKPHTSLYHVLHTHASETGRRTIAKTSAPFARHVAQLLIAVKLLSFS